MTLRAPFPWFGGKSRASALVWAGFGDVANYVEPFFGSGAVLLGRPTTPRIETVNDLDCYVANFWRATKFAPDLVAEHANWPVNEADLHARHRWLVAQDGPSSTEKIGVTGVLLDPPYAFDAGRDPSLYAVESATVAHDVREWAIENGANPRLRIALCGYEGEHEMPKTWECVAWKAGGGYAASAGNHENAKRERIWFSPHCDLVERQGDLFKAALQ